MPSTGRRGVDEQVDCDVCAYPEFATPAGLSTSGLVHSERVRESLTATSDSPDCISMGARRPYLRDSELVRQRLMPFLSRSFAALSALLLLQLTLLGSGTLCAKHRDAGGSHADARVANGMTMMSAANLASSSVVTSADKPPASPEDCGGLGSHDGCGLPWAPGQCSSMTTCDVSLAVTASVISPVIGPIVTVALPSPVLARSGPTFAPELPPPRA